MLTNQGQPKNGSIQLVVGNSRIENNPSNHRSEHIHQDLSKRSVANLPENVRTIKGPTAVERIRINESSQSDTLILKTRNSTPLNHNYQRHALSNSQLIPSPDSIGEPRMLSHGKTGVYAVTTMQSMPWLNTPAQGAKVKAKKTATGPKIVNQLFYDCIPHISDSFWQGVFADAGQGKFPKGFSYKNNTLIYKKRTKTDTIELPENINELISLCITFFKDLAGLRSAVDLESERLEREECLSRTTTLRQGTWGNIRSKSVKRGLLTQYVHDVSKTLNLNEDQRKYFKTILNTGFLLGYFTSSSVGFEDGAITGIKGLDWDERERIFKINRLTSETPKIAKLKDWIREDEYLNPNNKTSDRHIKWVSFITLWKKFLESFVSSSHSERSNPKLVIITDIGPVDPSYYSNNSSRLIIGSADDKYDSVTPNSIAT